MEDFLADSDLTLAMRRQALEDERAYRHHVDALSNFDVYVLDKLEVLAQGRAVLDTHHYADTLEIMALLSTCWPVLSCPTTCRQVDNRPTLCRNVHGQGPRGHAS